MNQEDFNLFTAAFSISRAKKGMKIQLEQQNGQLESLIKQFKGGERSEAVKLKIKEVESKIKDNKKEIKEIESSIKNYDKVYLKLEKKYFS